MNWLAPVVIAGSLFIIGLASLLLRRRYPLNDAPLIDAIDRLLPQTQCAQCGYSGCRPYAEAIASGAATNLCPPGGADTHQALDALMGSRTAPPGDEAQSTAIIDESECIGCALCLPACPVDAIVGANGYMHTVIENECTGCELCVPACPVDCISMVAAQTHAAMPVATTAAKPTRPCISCDACVPVCPVGLDPHLLLRAATANDTALAARKSVDRCIECGLCDRVCPSEIPLAQIFHDTKEQVRRADVELAQRLRLKQRYSAHLARQSRSAEAKESRREARLRQPRRWT